MRLVEYPESSDDEARDARSDYGAVPPSSPCDSFSYPMREAAADDEEEEGEEDDDDDENDEDYAPSERSLEIDYSDASSVDTEDLDPENDMRTAPEDDNVTHMFEGANLDNLEDDSVIDLTREEEKKDVFYAWKDLQEAFADNPFKRRNVDTRDEETEEKEAEVEQLNRDEQTETETRAAKANLFDVEQGRWSFQATFAPGVADKKKTRNPHRRQTPTAHRPTEVSPRFSTHFSERAESATTTAAPMQHSQEQQKRSDSATIGRTNYFQVPQVEIPVFSFGAKQSTATSAPKTPDFTFGKTGTVASDDAYMRSPSPRRTPRSPFVSVDGEFSIGRSGNAPKPFKFAGNGAAKVSATVPAPIKIVDNGDDTHMRSPSPQTKPTAQTPTNGEFLFGQAYKNRKPFAFSRQSSTESCHSTASASTPTSTTAPFSWGSKVSAGDTSTGVFGVSSEPASAQTLFTPGVAGQNYRNWDRRKKKTSTRSSIAPPPNGSSQFNAASLKSSFFQTGATAHQQPSASFASPGPPFNKVNQSGAQANGIPPKNPPAVSTNGSFVFGKPNSETFREADPSPVKTGIFGTSSAAPATTNNGISGHVLFGNGTSHHPFEFGESMANSTSSRFTGQRTDMASTNSAAHGFHIGSSDGKKNPRVRPRRSGMFTNKNSPRKDAKIRTSEPEPSPVLSSSPSATPSPFGMHSRRRKNARLRQHGRSPPADPFVTHTFHPAASFVSSQEGSGPNVVRPTAKKNHSFSFGAPAASDNPFGTGNAEEHVKPSEPAVFSVSVQQNKPHVLQTSKSQQTPENGSRPTFAGSRRILRAALRNVGARGDRVRSAPPTTTGSRRDEADSEMDSEDERDWLELKRLGGVAHGARKYEDAAEYYRQSIEVLESVLYHNASLATAELRTDKAKLHANRAASLMMLMQITEAQQECRRSIEVDATYARAYLRLGRIQVLLGDTGHAQANIDTAKQLMEGNGDVVSSSDQADHASLAKMEESIKKLTKLQGEIKWYVDCGDFKQALVHTESALVLAPNSRKLQVQKARILLHQRAFDQVVEFCASIVEKQSANGKQSSPATRDGPNTKSHKDKTVENIAFIGIELGLLWATTLHYQNKIEDAVRILNALEVVAPCSSHVIQLKRQWQEMKQLKHDGNERFKRGEYQEAVRFYSEAVQIDPQHQEFCAIIYCNRAAAQMALERYHTAILDCNEALQRKPHYLRALLRRARCHVALKMHHEAVKDFDRYLREQPNYVSAEETADIRRERNEAKAAIAKAREEAAQREAAKKRAEREQRQRRSQRWEEPSWNGFYNNFNNSNNFNNFRHGASSNNGSSSRYQSSGGSNRASFMAPKTQRRTHYDVLGIEKTSTNDQIKKAYRKLALVYHPDKAKTAAHGDLFKEMTAAYNVLSDESARAKYDRELIYNRFGNFYEN